MKNSMKTQSLVRGIATLAVCALALAALGSAKNPVTRPHQSHGSVAFILYLEDYSWEFHVRLRCWCRLRLRVRDRSLLIRHEGLSKPRVNVLCRIRWRRKRLCDYAALLLANALG